MTTGQLGSGPGPALGALLGSGELPVEPGHPSGALRDGSGVLEQLTSGQDGKVVEPEINPDDGLGVGGDWIVTFQRAAEGHRPPAGLLFDGGREHPGHAGHHLVGQRPLCSLVRMTPSLGNWTWRSSRTRITPVLKRKLRWPPLFLKLGNPMGLPARAPPLESKYPFSARARASKPEL